MARKKFSGHFTGTLKKKFDVRKKNSAKIKISGKTKHISFLVVSWAPCKILGSYCQNCVQESPKRKWWRRWWRKILTSFLVSCDLDLDPGYFLLHEYSRQMIDWRVCAKKVIKNDFWCPRYEKMVYIFAFFGHFRLFVDFLWIHEKVETLFLVYLEPDCHNWKTMKQCKYGWLQFIYNSQ